MDTSSLAAFAASIRASASSRTGSDFVEITGLESPLDSMWVDFDVETTCTRHLGCEWLRATHSAEATGQD